MRNINLDRTRSHHYGLDRRSECGDGKESNGEHITTVWQAWNGMVWISCVHCFVRNSSREILILNMVLFVTNEGFEQVRALVVGWNGGRPLIISVRVFIMTGRRRGNEKIMVVVVMGVSSGCLAVG